MEFADRIDSKLSSRFDEVLENSEKYFLIPLALIMLGAGALLLNYTHNEGTGDFTFENGTFLDKGTDFAGGTEITFEVEGEFNSNEIEAVFADAGREGANALTRNVSGRDLLLVEIPLPVMSREEGLEILNNSGYEATIDQYVRTNPSVSQTFFKQAQFAFILAFTTMSIVIFYAFKNFTPAVAVVFAAAGDIIIAAGGMAVFGIPLTLGSLAALLMLIGYSVDTDIVLSTRVLRMNRGSVNSRMWDSLKTGVTMSSGGVAGFAILYIVSYSMVGPSELSNIAAVMVIGLLADMPLTWLGNTAILKKYVEADFDIVISEVLPWN